MAELLKDENRLFGAAGDEKTSAAIIFSLFDEKKQRKTAISPKNFAKGVAKAKPL